MKTLLVDANKTDRAWLNQQLSAAGHEITEAEDGVTAAESLEKSPFSLVVTDWMIGDMTGLELVQMIKRSPESRSTHVMMVSKRSDASSVAKALESGVDDYLVKPCQPEELIARAKAVLRRPANQATTDILNVGPVTLDKASHKVSVGESELSLSPVEFRLINFFMETPGVFRSAAASGPGMASAQRYR